METAPIKQVSTKPKPIVSIKKPAPLKIEGGKVVKNTSASQKVIKK